MPVEPGKSSRLAAPTALFESVSLPLTESLPGRSSLADSAAELERADLLQNHNDQAPSKVERRTGNTLSPSVDIVIPVFNQLAYTRQCLDSLRQNTAATARIIVVDNGSKDGTSAFLRTPIQLTVVSNQENLGCAAAWNQGVTAGTADWVAILNNDILLTPGWLDGLLAAATQSGLDIVSPAVREGPLNYDPEVYGREFVRAAGNAIRLGVVHGICFLTRRRVFETIGLFDENFRIGQFEDADFFHRARQAGFKLGTTGRSFIHHFGSVTQNCLRQSKVVPFYEAKNRAYYRRKWQLAWHRRYLQRIKAKGLLIWWRARERRQSGHSLNERWQHGRLIYG